MTNRILKIEVKYRNEVIAIKGLLLEMRKMPVRESEIIGIEDVCRLTGYAKNTFYQHVHQNKIPYHKPEHGGRKLIFFRSEIENWLKGRKPETSEAYCERKELELYNSMKGGVN
ncbi:transcriptional regulator, AlpA family [Tangfeifania diversioriginum]|uniref:Transcriptional regulator, AlpA family n=1 Tax=Tangfeifania diversioriginum TaxID=1168035 RepID=A0A1M6MXI0_9BACT|nr:helix-turn-helix domain-containing protein [Tangfeifania diversioriginum]SHJ88155.1 transcriptional regulator, AlpA family [Tangfeifania diversioriginum]